MKALIYERAECVGVGLLDVAGRPLLVRQLQWLRSLGIEEVVVELAVGAGSAERATLLLGTDPLSTGCLVLPTRAALGASALSARAGLLDDELFLALPADTLVSGPLALPGQCTRYAVAAPAFAAQLPAIEIAIASRSAQASEPTAALEGWALRIGAPTSAHALSCAVLAGQVAGVVVHAAELRPGIWLARGARVSEDATLLPPVLIGPEARVFARARVGPNVVLGKGALIERDVVLSETVVAPDTLIGEGMRVRQAQVDERGITSLPEHTRTDVRDSLQLASTRGSGPLFTSRLAALLLALVLLAPWTLCWAIAGLSRKRVVQRLSWHGRALHVGTLGLGVLDLLPALLDVMSGRRDLVGVALPAPLALEGARSEGLLRAGAIDISRALAPAASTSTLLWMWRWYLQNKSASLDWQLWLRQRVGLGAKKKST